MPPAASEHGPASNPLRDDVRVMLRGVRAGRVGEDEALETITNLILALGGRCAPERTAEYPTLSERQTGRRRARERALCEETAADPAEQLRLVEASLDLQEEFAAAGLTGRERDVFVLRMSEFSKREVAEILCVSERTVAYDFARARAKMAAHRERN